MVQEDCSLILLKIKTAPIYRGGSIWCHSVPAFPGLSIKEMASKPKNSFIEFFLSGWRYRMTISYRGLIRFKRISQMLPVAIYFIGKKSVDSILNPCNPC